MVHEFFRFEKGCAAFCSFLRRGPSTPVRAAQLSGQGRFFSVHTR